MGNVFISPNLKKETVRINADGAVIDKNKNVIEPLEEVYVKEAQVEAPVKVATVNATDIQKQIEEAEAKVVELKALKAQKIAEMKKQLEELEA